MRRSQKKSQFFCAHSSENSPLLQMDKKHYNELEHKNKMASSKDDYEEIKYEYESEARVDSV